ncbi:MAG: type II toxin-antitoxin system HicA family toxin [Dehalococcoidia bacterium]
MLEPSRWRERREFGRVAEQRGWVFQRSRGDHFIYAHPQFRMNLSIPDHREVRIGVLGTCIRTMGMTVDEFIAALRD